MNIWVPRPGERGEETAAILNNIAGVNAFWQPVISIDGKQTTLTTEYADAWLFTSQYAVQYWLSMYTGVAKPKVIIAIGSQTEAILKKYGFHVDFVARIPFTSEALLSDDAFWGLDFYSIFIISGEGGRETLLTSLSKAEKLAIKVVCYQRNKISIAPEIMLKFLLAKKVNAVLITSVDILEALVFNIKSLDIAWQSFVVIAFSERVFLAAKQAGFRYVYACESASMPALIGKVEQIRHL